MERLGKRERRSEIDQSGTKERDWFVNPFLFFLFELTKSSSSQPPRLFPDRLVIENSFSDFSDDTLHFQLGSFEESSHSELGK